MGIVWVKAGLEASENQKLLLRFRRGACKPDNSRPGKARDVCILRVHLDFSKVGTQFQLLLRAQILVPEEDHASLRNQESELILWTFSGYAQTFATMSSQRTLC